MKSYQTWFDLEEKKLKKWWQFYPKSEFYRKTREGKLIGLGSLQPNQNPYNYDDDGIYRMLYGEKWYYYTTEDIKRIKKERGLK